MNDIQDVLKEMDLFLEDSTYIPDVDEWKAVIEAAMREKDEAHRAAMRTCMEWRRKEKVEIEKLRDMIDGIRTYASDTLSKPMGATDDRKWYRDGVIEINKRANATLAGKEPKT